MIYTFCYAYMDNGYGINELCTRLGEREFPQTLFICLSGYFLLGCIESKRQVGLGWR